MDPLQEHINECRRLEKIYDKHMNMCSQQIGVYNKSRMKCHTDPNSERSQYHYNLCKENIRIYNFHIEEANKNFHLCKKHILSISGLKFDGYLLLVQRLCADEITYLYGLCKKLNCMDCYDKEADIVCKLIIDICDPFKGTFSNECILAEHNHKSYDYAILDSSVHLCKLQDPRTTSFYGKFKQLLNNAIRIDIPFQKDIILEHLLNTTRSLEQQLNNDKKKRLIETDDDLISVKKARM